MANHVSGPRIIRLAGRPRIQVQQSSDGLVQPQPRRRPQAARRLVGLDLGQRQDYTALAVVEDDGRYQTLRALERIRNRPYPDIALLVAQTMAALGRATLLVDTTGVGRPICDQLLRLGVHHMRVAIHGGATMSRLDDGTLSVPKRDLIAALVLGFESRRLRIAAGLPLADALEAEASGFQMKLSAAGHDSYNAREGEHDDLLLALAMPVWWAARSRPFHAAAGGERSGPLIDGAQALRGEARRLPHPAWFTRSALQRW